MPPADRWWTDVEKAQQVLSIVGGDDVAQSVGTVALGYHAVVADKLRPLCTRTLVDQADVTDALDDVDLLPVAKAMAAAVSPVLGSAAGAYAADLVTQLHVDTHDGITHELRILTSKSVPMPQALERVCGVAGVPVRAVNGYVQKMAQPQVNPRVLADEGDRTLMTWASRLGKREASSPLEDVGKAQGQWEPEEHPRSGDNGQFVSAGEEGAVDPRKARLARLSRLSRLSGQQKQVQAERAAAAQQAEERKRAEKKSLADLQAEVLGRRQPGRAREGRVRQGRERQGRVRQGRAREGRAQEVQQPQDAPKAEEQTRAVERLADSPRAVQRQDSGLQMHQRTYTDVDPSNNLHLVMAQPGQIISAAEMAKGGGDTIYRDPDEQPPGSLRLVLEDARASHDHGDGTLDLDLNHDYEVVDVQQTGEIGLDTLMVLRRVGEGSGVARLNELGKADFEEAEHPRDEGGRFAEADARRQRLDRIARIGRVAGQRKVAAAASQAQAAETEDDAVPAAVARIRQGRTRQGRARQGRERQGRLRATGRKAAVESHAQAGDEEILGKHKTALLINDFTLSQLTGHYAGDDELSGPVALKETAGQSVTDVKRLMSHTLLAKPGEVAGYFSRVAARNLKTTQDQTMLEMEHGDVYFDSAAEAMREAKAILMGEDSFGDDVVYVPGVKEGPGPNLFQPAIFEQPLKPEPDAPDALQHVIVGDDAAILRLNNGQTHGLELRRVKQHLDAEQLSELGGGTADTQMIDPYVNATVFEVVDTRQGRNRRA